LRLLRVIRYVGVCDSAVTLTLLMVGTRLRVLATAWRISAIPLSADDREPGARELTVARPARVDGSVSEHVVWLLHHLERGCANDTRRGEPSLGHGPCSSPHVLCASSIEGGLCANPPNRSPRRADEP
jgi:hypothetical protein